MVGQKSSECEKMLLDFLFCLGPFLVFVCFSSVSLLLLAGLPILPIWCLLHICTYFTLCIFFITPHNYSPNFSH